jgi:hypothetical protein
MQEQALKTAQAAYLKALANAIRHTYGCGTLHQGSRVVSVRFEHRTVKLQVETFQLIRYWAGDKCFAWFHPPMGYRRNMIVATVIADANILTASDAVQAYLDETYDRAA